MANDNDLLPCPFCGGEAELRATYDIETGAPDGWFVWCNNVSCECSPETNDHLTEEEAIAAWNTRAERTCKDVGERRDFACSECGARLYTETINCYTMILGDEETILLKPNYCPSCGSKVITGD